MRKQTQKKLLTTIKNIYQNIKPESNEEFIRILQITKSIFKEELSASRFQFYSELLDGIILAVTQFSQETNASARQEMFNLSKDLLKYIFNELAKEKEIKKDIVFLPYKASMWDSLESIWQAAYEDKEHCNTYVIPIPYADRKPDQSVAAWHCEVDLYPKYVPVLDYRTIDLAEMHPDIIFIHNPYDNYNALTSVDSQYYSDELKKCTDMLVYVPYFVTEDIKPGDEEREEFIAGLITTQGVINSDLVVVQSENIRQVYINVLLKYSTQKDRKYWEQRIVGLGSPKYDKVLAVTKEDVTIPENWLKIIQKSDKTWKKIIFYNIGLSPMLAGKEILLNKMEDDFRIFKEYKDEIALLWRPHPLLKATMSGMLPELQQRYEEIVERYKSEGWGIYDDTADLNRAIVISDAYFGDGSSVLRLYETTKKPIMYHRNNFSSESSKVFKITKAYYEDNQIWCTMLYDPYLYKIDLETRELSEVTPILDEDDSLDSYMLILPYKDFFIFIQSNTNMLIIMNRTTFHKSKYKIPSASGNLNRLTYKFANAFIYNDNLYIFGFNYKGIVKLNLLTKEFFVIDEFLKELKITNHNELFCIYDYIEVDDKLYFPMANTNAVLEFSLNNEKVTVNYVGDEKQRYISGAWDGNNIWLAPRDRTIGNIVKWNPKTNSTKQYANFPRNNELGVLFGFDKVFKIENSIIMMSPMGTNSCLEINLDTEEITIFNDIYDAKDQSHFGEIYFCSDIKGNDIVYIDEFDLIKYDFKSKKSEKISLKPSKNILKRIDEMESIKLKSLFKPLETGKSCIYFEQRILNLYHLLKFLTVFFDKV